MKINISKKSIIKEKLTKEKIIEIATTAVLALAHIAVIISIIMSYKYYGIYPSLFGSIVGVVVCVLIIIDIVFFVGFNHKDIGLKITTIVLSALIMIGGTVGSYTISRVNGAVNGVLSDGSKTGHETFSGVFVTLNTKNYTSLENLKGKKVGMLRETTNGLTYIAKSILDEQKFDYATVDTYESNTELLQALLNGEVSAVAITSAYKDIYKNDDNSVIKEHLDEFVDFYPFQRELKVESTKKKKNLMTEPFNVLLIGWSRTDIGSTVGLADAIIVATINPQTYTVSMMSIARDSFVPISCYGGAYDKINSGRSTSRSCFIETVEDFIGMDIDYYMEADYGAIVRIVNVVGGVEIDNPVDFELDGVFVPAGKYVAEGWQALEFCRERHHMPNGDFDRQKHQKEVILAICRKFIESGDITMALSAMEQSSEFLDTNFTLQELSTVFNLLLNTKNFTSLDTFDLVDFQNLRITGNGGLMYYSYSMRLPLWVYLIYQGSYDESINHIYDVMGKYNSYDQIRSFEFSAQSPYERAPFYSLDYENKYVFTPDPMPAYWASLTGMTLVDAMAWAAEKGVSLSVSDVIKVGDPRYNAELDGLVYSQSVAYGSLVSDYPSGSVVMMGSGEIDDSKYMPNFVGKGYQRFIEWADRVGVDYGIVFDKNADPSFEVGKIVSQSEKTGTPVSTIEKVKIVVRAGTSIVKFDLNGFADVDGLVTPEDISVVTGDKEKTFSTYSTVTKDNKRYRFLGWFTQKEGGDEVTSTASISKDTTLYAHWEFDCDHDWIVDVDNTDIPATCENAGKKYEICSICGKKQEVVVDPLGHNWIEDSSNIGNSPATCTESGTQWYKCDRDECNETKSETINPLGHNWIPDDETNPTSWTCSRCSTTVTENPN